MDAQTPIGRVVQHAGGQAALAKRLGVAAPTVHQWVTGARQVPAERCPDIEDLVNGAVTCEELRPDVNWSVLRRRFVAAGDAVPKGASLGVSEADLDLRIAQNAAPRVGWPVTEADLDRRNAEKVAEEGANAP